MGIIDPMAINSAAAPVGAALAGRVR